MWLGGRPTPLVVLCAGGMPRILLLVSAPQKWQKVFSVLFCFVLFPFWVILVVALICPNGASMHLFLVLIVSLYFAARGGVCSGANTAVSAAKGPRPQTVLDSLRQHHQQQNLHVVEEVK